MGNSDIMYNVFISVLTFILALYAFFCNVIVICLDSFHKDEDKKITKTTKQSIKKKKLTILKKERLEEKSKDVLNVKKNLKKDDSQSSDENNSLVNTRDETKSEDDWKNIEDKYSHNDSNYEIKIDN